MPEPSKLDLYQTITDRIVAALESGLDKVSLPWHHRGVLHPAEECLHRARLQRHQCPLAVGHG